MKTLMFTLVLTLLPWTVRAETVVDTIRVVDTVVVIQDLPASKLIGCTMTALAVAFVAVGLGVLWALRDIRKKVKHG